MNRRKLIADTKEKDIYRKWEIRSITDNLLASLFEALQRGEKVNLSNVGKFELKVSKARKATHPKAKQPTHIPEKVNVVFTVS